ncbi:TPA: helix-turn-helix domain-containing protein [Photobacterium damselae]|uniref:helix-turn-helix domain-containing protein n=1 Tax=Photobacterium damselae TaxID=38293 RepID=UPI0021FA6ED4|nr:AraC family transcriptional regulator [Photobacterium damselae]BDR35726.1 hypothetical protein PDY_27740 [Photobacterium damselae subsp. damselae]
MYQRAVAQTAKFLMFDMQKLEETQHLIFGADYILIHPNSPGCILHLATHHLKLQPNQIVLLAPFNPFRLSLEKNSCSRRASVNDCDVLHFRLNALGQTFVDSVQFANIRSMLEQAKSGLLFSGEQLSLFNEYFQKMENTFEFKQVLNLLALLDELAAITPERYLINNCIEISNSKRAEDRVQMALKYIENNLAEPLTVTVVAEQLCMAESTFSRFFHANLGVTFRQYLIEQRVKQAARYLVSTDWSVAHIGAEVGFSSLSNFNAKFKSILRVTPREYRTNHLDMRQGIEQTASVQGQVQKQMLELVNS